MLSLATDILLKIEGNSFCRLIWKGDTKKRPVQPETARGLEITPGVLEYCLNRIFVEIIMEYDVKSSLTVSVNVQVMY